MQSSASGPFDEDSHLLSHEPLTSYPPVFPMNEMKCIHTMLWHRFLLEFLDNFIPDVLAFPDVRRVFDLSDGLGLWAAAVAQRYPDLQVVSVGESEYALRHVRAMARERKLDDVTFLEMQDHRLDVTSLSEGSFDLVRLGFQACQLLPAEIPPLMSSLARLNRPNGYLLWIESEFPLTNSAACEQYFALLLQGLLVAGRNFIPGCHSLGITARMSSNVQRAGYHIVETSSYALDPSISSSARDMFIQHLRTFVIQTRPFLLATNVIDAREFEILYTQMQREMQPKSFCAVCFSNTVIGERRI